MNAPGWRQVDSEDVASRPRFRLHDLACAMLLLGLVLANLAPAARSGSDREWIAAALVFTIFGMLLSPVLLICLVIRLSPTSLTSERQAVGLVMKTVVAIVLLTMAVLIHAR